MPKLNFAFKTWNPTIGCTKISAACMHCYAESFAHRLQKLGSEIYKDGFKFKMLPERLNEPLKNKAPTIYFTNSMSDLFHERMGISFLDQILDIIERTPHHQYQILTKRPERMREYFLSHSIPQNVWLGTTVENSLVKWRIKLICDLPANIKWLSCEPLLSDLGKIDLSGIDWVVSGGESGARARRMQPIWLKNLRDRCHEQNVAFYFRQWGAWGEDGVFRDKFTNGSTIDGKTYKNYPSSIAAKLFERTLFDF